MDFLSLFPTTSQQSSLIFSAYRQMGLLCWSAAKQNELLLVSAIKSDVGNDKQNVLFKCVSKISLSPELPRNMDFDQILVNQTGSLVALIGKKMVFVVEMDQEFWDRRHIPGLNFEASVEHLRPQYFARTDLVHITLFMRKYPPTVLKAIWFEHRPDENGIFKNAQIQNGLLALLFSDNVIRLYNIPSLMDRPQFQLDFNTLLPDWSPAASESGDEIGGVGSISRPHSTLGFITQLVSFDFGPIQSSTGGSTSTQSATLFGSLLAMDSNGEIYMGFFPFQQQNSNAIPPPFGPLPCHFPQTQPPISSRLLCAARDLYSIRHSHSQHISLWSLASEDGILIHFALSQRNGTDNLNNFAAGNSPPCELFALECLEIEGNDQQKEDSRKAASSKLWDVTKLTKNTATTNYQFAKILRLMNDLPNASSPSYFAICSRDLFRIDLTELVAHLLQNCANFHQSQKFAPTKLPQSIVHQMLMFMDSGEGKNANITSVSSLELQSSNFLGPSTSSNQQLELEDENRQHFLAAMCSTNNSAQKQFDGNGKTSPILQWKHSFMATLINAGPSNSTNISSPSLLDSLLSPPSQKPKQQRNLPKLPSISEEIRRQLAGERNYNILPTIKFDEEIEGDEQQKLAQRLKILSLVLNVLQNILLERALPARQNAIEFATQRAVLLLAGFQAVEQFRENAQLRLTNIFRQITDLKSQILRRQHQIQMLEERIRKIALALQPLMFPAPEEEEEAIENLRKMQQRLMECRREMKKLDQRLCEHRQFIFANPSNSSHHSSNMMMGGGGGGPMPAQMFILSKNGRQCAKLREQIQQLMKGKNNG